MKHRHDEQHPTLFDAATVYGDGPAAPSTVGEPEAEYRPGFKKVKRLGWVPEDWDVVPLGKVVTDLKSGLSRKLSTHDIGLPVLRSNNITDEGIDYSDLKYWYREDPQGAKTENHFLREGDLLINFINSVSQIGKCALYTNELDRDVICTTNIMKLTFNERVNANFFHAITKTNRYRSFIYSITKPAVNQASFTTVDLKKFKVALPPLQEQTKIARILGTWDRALAQLDALITAKEQRLKGLAQRLLMGEEQLPKYRDQPWCEGRIGSLLKPVKRPVVWKEEELYRLISLRRGSAGLFFRNPLYGHQIKTKNLMTVHTGDFLISKMQVVHGATGIVTPEFDGAHVSGSYMILVPRREDAIDTAFYAWLAKLPYMYHVAYLASYGVHIEKMTFNPKLYFKTKIMVPRTVDEQRDIMTLLDTAEAEIDLLHRERDALAEQKKGLMQRLLMGEVRVTPDPDDL